MERLVPQPAQALLRIEEKESFFRTEKNGVYGDDESSFQVGSDWQPIGAEKNMLFYLVISNMFYFHPNLGK